MDKPVILGPGGHPIHDAIAMAKSEADDLAQRENEAALTIEFDKLALKAGETLVLRPSAVISEAEADSLLETARRALPPGVGVLLVQYGTEACYFDAETTARIMAAARPTTTH